MMFSQASVLAVVALITSTVNAEGCYGGYKWPSPDVASNHISRACHGYPGVNGEHVQGAFENLFFKANSESDLPATTCVNENDYHIDLWITHKKNPGKTLDPDVCFNLLNDLTHCLSGGEGGNSDWWVRADPNTGTC